MRNALRVTSLSAGVVLSLALTIHAGAADKEGRLSGRVLGLDKTTSEIMIQQGTAHRVVRFTDATKFVMGSSSNTKTAEPGSADRVQAGNYLTCVGTWDNVKLAASRCSVRPSKRP